MSGIDKSVNSLLTKMRATGGTGKGSIGEQAVFKICEQFYLREGGILIHSYSYNTDDTQAGNIKKSESGNLYIEALSGETELDILYISKFRIFPIEVKAYKANSIKFDDAGIYGCYKTDKSPIHQNEMHCRHFYQFIYRSLPQGCTDYIVPVVCMVDKASIIDERSDWQKEYIKLCVLNNLEDIITQNNTPLDFQLNLSLIDSLLKENMVSSEKYLPPRY